MFPDGIRPATIHLRNGKVHAILAFETALPPGAPLIDAGALVVMPGIVDTHVHINDPGRADWEGFETATMAAAAGGVTTLVDMPLNSIPPTTTLNGLEEKIRAAEGRTWVDFGICGGLVPSSVNDLASVYREGVLAFKCFLAESGVDEFSHVSDVELRAGLRELAKIDAPLFVHAELPGPLNEAAIHLKESDPRRYETYLRSRPKTAEDAAIDLVFNLSKETGARTHIVHLSSSTALPIVQRAIESGVPLTAETCPHYLTFASEEIPDGATAYKCAPPIRERENRTQLWNALMSGTLTQVVTDHSPSSAEMKCSGSGDFMKAWGGISSLQLGLAAVWTEARDRGARIEHIAEWMCKAPARLAGISGRKGGIFVGADADFAIWDPDASFEVDPKSLHHRHKITPYAGRRLMGRVEKTILGGRMVFERGSHVGRPEGRWVRRN